MEEWLRKLMSAIGGQGQVKPTPPFVASQNGYGQVQPTLAPNPNAPLSGASPVNNPMTPVAQPGTDTPAYQVPVQPRPPLPLPGTTAGAVSPPTSPTNPITTPEQQLADKLGQYNTLAQKDPKLAHNFKNNLLQGLFVGLQGVQRVADPTNAPQGPIKYLGEARRDYQLGQMAPMIQGLGAQVSARAAARKENLATQNTMSEITARDTDTKIKLDKEANPGMETIKDADGNILERPKGSNQPYKLAGGVTPVKKVSVTLSDGRSVDVPAAEAVRNDTAKMERDAQRALEQGKINASQAESYRKELDDWRQGEEKRTQQLVTWTNDALAKDQEAKKLHDQAKAIPGTKEALELETKAGTAEVERDRLFNQAKTSSPTPKPTMPATFTAPVTAPNKGKKVSKSKDPYNLMNTP